MTSAKIVAVAAKVLRDPGASQDAKAAAATVLTQKGSDEKTSVPVASGAARVLKDPKASKAAKSVAANALTQRVGPPRRQAQRCHVCGRFIPEARGRCVKIGSDGEHG